MSTETINAASSSSHTRSYRCYRCSYSYPIITTAAAATPLSCPRCHHRHLLPPHTTPSTPTPTIASSINPPIPQPLPSNSQALDFLDSDSDFYSNYPYPEPEDSFFEFFSSSTSPPSTLEPIVDRLPVVEVAHSASCSICMDEFELGTGASQLPCKHFFHKDCIAPWLDRSKTCPLCRRKLPNEESEKPLHSNWGFAVAEIEAIRMAESELERWLAIMGRADFDDISGWFIDPMHDADGDTLMVDAAL
ncbi:unnamed protein product [Cuscuta epithymum]|uniref:RING-type E3 ubiquitin transferase n=1 Tax=Cuscuta epithymum TaxID=186058 RepID=A0AAV0CSU4_9ASTE|nr:unnamed protein product [Cuscuta epithymum]